jgi:hypothetical protein
VIERPHVVLVPERHVDRRARGGHLHVGRDDGLPTADGLTHGLAELGMDAGGAVLHLAVQSHDGGLAIAHGRGAQHVDQALGQQVAEVHADVEERREVLHEPARIRVPHDGESGRAPDRTLRTLATLGLDVFRHDHRLPDVHVHVSVLPPRNSRM